MQADKVGSHAHSTCTGMLLSLSGSLFFANWNLLDHRVPSVTGPLRAPSNRAAFAPIVSTAPCQGLGLHSNPPDLALALTSLSGSDARAAPISLYSYALKARTPHLLASASLSDPTHAKDLTFCPCFSVSLYPTRRCGVYAPPPRPKSLPLFCPATVRRFRLPLCLQY